MHYAKIGLPLSSFLKWIGRESFIFIVGFPLLGILRVLAPILTVRIGLLHYNRLGHLVGNTELWLRKQFRSNGIREINIFFSGTPANRQVLRMIKRKAHVIESDLLARALYQLKIRRENSAIWINLDDPGFNSWEIWNNVRNQLEFTDIEIQQGEVLLESIGVSNGAAFVCFCSRDKTYLNQARDSRKDGHQSWDYHNYRDCTIVNYLSAADYLTTRGLWALRMGAVVETPIDHVNKHIVDYASKHRTDFADVYLLTHCKFFLGCTAGNFILPSAFGIPCALANMTPLATAARNSNDLFIPKKYWHAEFGRFLKFHEILELGAGRWHRTQQFEEAGITAIENTAEEILDLAIEMNARLDGTWIPHAGDDDLQARYRSLFPLNSPIAGYPSRVGAIFLRKNRHLLNQY